MSNKSLIRGSFLLIMTIIFVAGCERSTDHDNGHIDDMEVVHIIDRTLTARPVIATWTHDDGWDVDVLYELSMSAEEHRTRVSLGVEVYNSLDQKLELCEGCENEIRYWLATGAQTGIIDLSDEDILFHGDHVHIYGLATGETRIEFILWHDDHADAATTPVSIRVTE
jgi:hypothetical protein